MMQSSSHHLCNWIMVYQCHFTNKCILHSLTSKRAHGVTFQLVGIFLLLGAPNIFQSEVQTEEDLLSTVVPLQYFPSSETWSPQPINHQFIQIYFHLYLFVVFVLVMDLRYVVRVDVNVLIKAKLKCNSRFHSCLSCANK